MNRLLDAFTGSDRHYTEVTVQLSPGGMNLCFEEDDVPFNPMNAPEPIGRCSGRFGLWTSASEEDRLSAAKGTISCSRHCRRSNQIGQHSDLPPPITYRHKALVDSMVNTQPAKIAPIQLTSALA